MSLKNIRTAEQLRAEATARAAEAQEQARLRERTAPDVLAGLVDRVEDLERRLALLDGGTSPEPDRPPGDKPV